MKIDIFKGVKNIFNFYLYNIGTFFIVISHPCKVQQ